MGGSVFLAGILPRRLHVCCRLSTGDALSVLQRPVGAGCVIFIRRRAIRGKHFCSPWVALMATLCVYRVLFAVIRCIPYMQVVLSEQVPGATSDVAADVGTVRREGFLPEGSQGTRRLPVTGDVISVGSSM